MALRPASTSVPSRSRAASGGGKRRSAAAAVRDERDLPGDLPPRESGPLDGSDERTDAGAARQRDMRPTPVSIRAGYAGSGKLAGKAALISGGDSGIGRAVALHFAREGCDVAFMYLEQHEDAVETRRLVEAEGRRCLAIAGDARSDLHCRNSVERVIDKLGRLDVLVNNLGTHTLRDKPEDISSDQLRQTFETNVYPFFYLTRYALRHLKPGACIINTGAVTSFRGHQDLIDYAASKGAVESFTYSLARKLAPRGIRVNGVAPGPIWTPLITSAFPPDKLNAFGRDTLLQRAGQPAEVGPAFVYLACEDSSYVTGQFVHVNGGGFIG